MASCQNKSAATHGECWGTVLLVWRWSSIYPYRLGIAPYLRAELARGREGVRIPSRGFRNPGFTQVLDLQPQSELVVRRIDPAEPENSERRVHFTVDENKNYVASFFEGYLGPVRTTNAPDYIPCTALNSGISCVLILEQQNSKEEYNKNIEIDEINFKDHLNLVLGALFVDRPDITKIKYENEELTGTGFSIPRRFFQDAPDITAAAMGGTSGSDLFLRDKSSKSWKLHLFIDRVSIDRLLAYEQGGHWPQKHDWSDPCQIAGCGNMDDLNESGSGGDEERGLFSYEKTHHANGDHDGAKQ